ncbi:synaptic ras gtpase activating protein, syngap,putative [Schistosoma mansoni]|uniref:synaptic ras gtpase activating protein, syngap,putative n=1 Tax=Schistosoma mansoni TaxID=6183 RepID=UPI0001A6287D|nr:synaptic ras gtpase activating protein, syngap,putative [Schistosoma mansoni]|eukprot:XP_018646437.1 synaptic ras gtpase activating protein, syngap,putative [Schistosoma mansoni]
MENFLQRGFQSKRPKSMVKSERRKITKHRSGSSSNSDHNPPGSSSVISSDKAIVFLGEQIRLPTELYNVFEINPTESSKTNLETTDDVSHLVQICNIDPSLIGSNCNYYFQVMSPSQRMIKASTICLNSSKRKTDDVQCSCLENNGDFSAMNTPNLLRTVSHSQGNVRETVNIPFVIHNYSCQSALERDRWVQFLKRLVNPSQDAQRRKENCLNIWIQEAKGLHMKNRYYCTILVNGTICARTTIKQMTDMLFWGEEFDLSGLTNCSVLTIEIWKVCDTKASSPSHRHLTASPHRLTTSNLRQQTNTSPPMRKVMMTCTKAADDGSVSPPDFTALRNSVILDDLSTTYTNNDEVTSRQKRRKFKSSKMANPSLIATVNISLSDISNCGEVESWYTPNLNDSMTQSSGQLKQSDNKNSGESNVNKTKSKGRRSNRHEINLNSIQIRVKIRYRALIVLPLTSYARLENNLCQFQLPKTITLTNGTDKLNSFKFDSNPSLNTSSKPDLIQLLSSLDPWLNVKAKAELAGAMVVLQQARGQVTGFLASLILCEVKKQSDPNMVLRANSIATKATEIYLRLVGGSYLSNILSDFVQIVISGRPVDPQLKTSNRYPIDYEVDIAKVQTSAQLAQNQVNLLGLVETVWKRILSSEVEFPEQFRALFVEIRRYLENGLKSNYSSMNNIHNKHYDGLNSSNSTMNDGTLCEHVISACLFLRYICPAILSPSLFNLIYEFPSEPRILRAFTLVAKTIQTLANFSLFSGSKETYMKFMNQFVTDQLPAMRQFLQSISVPNPKTTSSYKSLLNNDTVLKPINSLSNIYNNNNSTIHGNSSNNGSMPHSLHIIGSDENCLKSTMSNKVKMKTSSKENNHFINNSQSHHGGFINDIDDYSSHSRQSPVFTSSEITSKLNDIKSSVNGSSMSQKYQSTKSTCNSICLPPLPTNQHGHLGLRDHVDLPLCLALCHLQLSEAIEKVPEDKRMPDVKELKSILDEVNAFLVSGKDPQPNWWHKTTINNNDNNTNHNSNITTISIKDSTPTRKTTAKTISENINNEPKTNSKSLCFQSHRNKPMSNEASIYECTNNESKFIMNTSSSSVHKSINLSDDGGTTISVLNSSITSVISPKQIVCPDIKDSHHDYKEQQVKTTSDSNIKFVISKGRYNNPCIQERVTPRCDSIEIIRIPHSNNHNNSMNTNNEEIYDIMNPTNSHAASLPIDQNVSKKVTESNHDSSTMTQRDNRRRRRVQSARKTQEPIIIHQNIVDTDNNIHVSNTLQKSSGIDHQHLSNHSASIDICSDIMNPEPIEHSEFNPIYLGNSSSSGYFTISSHGNILNYPSIEQESVIVDPIIISTSDNEIITSLSTTSTTDISSMNNPLYTCHSLKQISSINSNDFQKQMTIVDDPNHSLGLCSPQPKKTSQNSVRRHTYVNLSNDVHGTDRLIDALKNNHSNHKVNNIELDKRNWAPPMYISNEQRNRRITLTYPTSYEHVNTPTESINQNVLNYSGSEHLNLTNSFKSSPTEQELCQNSTLQTEIQRIKFIPLNTSYTIGAIPNKRTALFSSENNTPTTVIDLRSELDASQARLAEAQARLLANEAERIQILKSWQSELIKQSQLINASKAVGNNSPIPQFSSNVQLTNTENNLHCNPDENDFDESGPRSISVIPLLNSSALRSQDYSESIYDYDDSELMNNTELTKQYITDTNIQLHTSNGINRNLGLHASSPSSYLKSLRAHTNQPRMGASAVVTNLHDYHGAAPLMSDYLQSTIPRSRIITNRGYQLHNNTTTTITSPTNTELDEFCRISRSPSTPGLSNSNFTRTLPVDPVGGIDNELNSANNSIDPVTNDQEFARQIQAIVHENNQHLYS